MFASQDDKPFASQENYAYSSPSSETLSKSLRINFVRKVFSITAAQLLFTALFTHLSLTYTAVQNFQIIHSGWLIVASIACIASGLALGFSDTLSRKVPTNYILLSIFTLGESYLVSFIASQYDKDLVLMALFITAATVSGLAIYAITSKTEVTYIGGMIVLISTGIFFVGLLSWFVRLHALHGLIFFASCVTSGLYLIYDIKIIMGKESIKLSLDDYIRGAMHLYADIIRIFLKVLQILGELQDKDDKNKNKKKK